MSKFEPKIITDSEPRVYHADELNWCLRNVTSNLRAFKAEFLRQYFDEGTPTTPVILDDMLPDDPPKATGDDVRDAARFRWLSMNRVGVIHNSNGSVYLAVGLDGAFNGHIHATLIEAIDAAMAREAAK